MSELDDLLRALTAAARPELDALPLLSAPVFGPNGPILVGIYVRWLLAQDALVRRADAPCLPSLPSLTWLSNQLVAGELMLTDIAAPAQAFSTAYLRDTGRYMDDVVQVCLVQRARHVTDVLPDNNATYRAVATVIDRRWALFTGGADAWQGLAKPAAPAPLTAADRTPDGWLRAMAQLRLTDPVSEQARRRDLARFWALVDAAPDTADTRVLDRLVACADEDLGDGVMEAVYLAVAAFPFADALRALVGRCRPGTAPQRLGAFVDYWPVLDPVSAAELRRQWAGSNAAQQAQIQAAVRAGLDAGEDWAAQWRDALKRPAVAACRPSRFE